MYVRPISTRFVRGRSTPAIRAIKSPLPLPLLVLLIRTDHPHDAAAADDLAFVANLLDRCPDFHQLFLESYIFTSSSLPLHIFPMMRPRVTSTRDSSIRTRSPTSTRTKFRS